MDDQQLSNFQAALSQLGATNAERAAALGISRRQLIEYKQGRIPFHVLRLMRQPKVLLALAADAQAHQQQGSELQAT